MSQIATGSYGCGTPRFLNVNAKPSGTPASRSRRLASARLAAMSLPYPASFSSSAGGVAHGVPGTWIPPTSFTMAMRDRFFDPS